MSLAVAELNADSGHTAVLLAMGAEMGVPWEASPHHHRSRGDAASANNSWMYSAGDGQTLVLENLTDVQGHGTRSKGRAGPMMNSCLHQTKKPSQEYDAETHIEAITSSTSPP